MWNFLTKGLERQAALNSHTTVYEFTAPIAAQRVIEAIEQRWGRTVPAGQAGFYVHFVIPQQQVILLFGDQTRPRILSARIDFQSLNPVVGTLWFFDADDKADTEAAGQLLSGLAALMGELSPDSVFGEAESGVEIATWSPKDGRPTHHRRRR